MSVESVLLTNLSVLLRQKQEMLLAATAYNLCVIRKCFPHIFFMRCTMCDVRCAMCDVATNTRGVDKSDATYLKFEDSEVIFKLFSTIKNILKHDEKCACACFVFLTLGNHCLSIK